MKQLLQQPETHRMVLLIALAIGLGITVHEAFFVVAQILMFVACVCLMVSALRQRNRGTNPAHQ
jgi:uncharacterized protein YybS (DUF2232 family)